MESRAACNKSVIAMLFNPEALTYAHPDIQSGRCLCWILHGGW